MKFRVSLATNVLSTTLLFLCASYNSVFIYVYEFCNCFNCFYSFILCLKTGRWQKEQGLRAESLLFGQVISWSQDSLLWCGPISVLCFVWMWWSRMPHGWLFFQGNIVCFYYFVLVLDILNFLILHLTSPFNYYHRSKRPMYTVFKVAGPFIMRFLYIIIIYFFIGFYFGGAKFMILVDRH